MASVAVFICVPASLHTHPEPWTRPATHPSLPERGDGVKQQHGCPQTQSRRPLAFGLRSKTSLSECVWRLGWLVYLLVNADSVCFCSPCAQQTARLTTEKNLSSTQMTTASHRAGTADSKHTAADLNPPILSVSYPVCERVTSPRWLTAAAATGIPLTDRPADRPESSRGFQAADIQSANTRGAGARWDDIQK